MNPDLFTIATASPAVLALLGSNPTRLWPAGRAPQNQARPYAVHQVIYGTPENSLSCPATLDNVGIQVDAYAPELGDARAVARALRDAIETAGFHVVALNGETWEANTGLYRVSFTAELWVTQIGS